MLLVLPDTAVLAVPYPCRSSLRDTFAKHTRSTYSAHQLCQSVGDTDLLLKDTQGVGRAGNYAIVRCWGVTEACLQKHRLGSHSGLARGWEAGAIPALPASSLDQPLSQGSGGYQEAIQKGGYQSRTSTLDVHCWKLIRMHSFPSPLS